MREEQSLLLFKLCADVRQVRFLEQAVAIAAGRLLSVVDSRGVATTRRFLHLVVVDVTLVTVREEPHSQVLESYHLLRQTMSPLDDSVLMKVILMLVALRRQLLRFWIILVPIYLIFERLIDVRHKQEFSDDAMRVVALHVLVELGVIQFEHRG